MYGKEKKRRTDRGRGLAVGYRERARWREGRNESEIDGAKGGGQMKGRAR